MVTVVTGCVFFGPLNIQYAHFAFYFTWISSSTALSEYITSYLVIVLFISSSGNSSIQCVDVSFWMYFFFSIFGRTSWIPSVMMMILKLYRLLVQILWVSFCFQLLVCCYWMPLHVGVFMDFKLISITVNSERLKGYARSQTLCKLNLLSA